LTFLNNLNQLHSTPLSANPFASGQPITSADCTSVAGGTLANGKTVTGQAAINLNVACGNINPDSIRTAFPGYSSINELRDIADSHYHALQVSANRTVGDLTLSLAYSYSHAIDDSSDRADNSFVDSYNIPANRASSNFDMRHSLSISYVYYLPFFRGSGLAHNLLGGWQISGITVAQTGLPFTVSNGSGFGDNAGVGNGTSASGSRPDLVGDPRAGVAANDPTQRGPLFYNPAAFAIPRGLTFGNVGRNTLNLPGRLNFNFGLFKRFAINERTGLEFRWETFNIFNHTQFNSINNGFGPSNFLHLTGTHDPRRMQLGLRYYF
jgi:hypothetical protein